MAEMQRRDFLRHALGLWATLCALPVVATVLQFITPRSLVTGAKETLRVGSTADVERGGLKIVRFDKEPVVLIHDSNGQFKAFSARCTHLGCVIQFQTEGGAYFGCNCHGSEFDMNGRNIAGPAPRPLRPFRVSIEGTSIFLTKS